jgi:hypothetical protein
VFQKYTNKVAGWWCSLNEARKKKCVCPDMVPIQDMKVDTSVPAGRQLLIAWSLLFSAKGQVRLACGLQLGSTAGHTTASLAI